MRRRTFLFSVPILFWACFFIFGQMAQASNNIFYYDDFSTGQATGWQEQIASGAIWQVENGKYHLNIAESRVRAKSIYHNGFNWKNYIFSFDVDLNNGIDRNVIFRMQDEQNYYLLGLRGFWRYAPDDTPVIYLQRCCQGQCTSDEYRKYAIAYHFSSSSALNNETAHFSIEALDNKIKVYYNGSLIIDWQETTDDYPKFGTIGFSGWSGDYGFVDVAWYNLTAQIYELEKPATPEPVILVPGILGSWNISGRWQIDPIFHTYDNLMEALIAVGYKEDSLGESNPNLFTFPYDWRQDNNITASLLKQKINSVKQITGSDKVDIVAHSMGGLVTRSYVESSDYQNDIDQVIFLGTPHLGSPKSYLGYGGAIFTGQWGWLQKYLFQIEAATQGYLDLIDYIRVKVPAVEQLLPIYDYLKDKQADNSWQLRSYPLNYPQNNYLESLNSQVNLDLLRQRVKITNIVSSLGGDSTLNNIRVIPDPDLSDNKWQSGYPENLNENLEGFEMGDGDGTVPFYSANSLNDAEVIETNSSDHENLPTVMQKEIIKTLTGIEPTGYFNSKLTSTFKRWYFFRVYSPVDFAVIAPDGKKIGKDFINNTEINEMPDAFYSGFNDHAEFVLIPNPQDGEYKVELQGVDNGGEYTLISSIVNNNEEISREFSGSIEPDQQRDFNITYSAVDENLLSDLEPIDIVPPVITINKPIEGEKYLHNSNFIIDYSAIDDFAGVATTSITIDGQVIATTTIDLFNYLLGQHNLIIEAFDKAGNQAFKQINFEIITNIDDTIKDIQKIYSRDWLTSKIYYALLENAFKLLKIEVKYFDHEQELTEKLIKQTQDDIKLTDKQKQKLIDKYNRKLADLKSDRIKAINHSLNLIERLLNQIKKQNKINQQGYDIILSDINYLKINL